MMFGNPRFQEIFQFTEADLALNRDGLLSPSQIARFKRSSRIGSALAFAFFAVFFIMTLVASIGLKSVSIGGTVLWGVVCAGLGLVELRLLREMLFPKVPTIKTVSGHIVRGNPTSKIRHSFEVEVNGEAFKIKQDALSAFDAEKVYTFYLSAADNSPISVEELSDFSPVSEKSPEQIAAERFQKLYNFSPTDLSFNRNGQLSESQLENRRKVAKDNGGCFGLALAIAIVIASATINAFDDLIYSALIFLILFLVLAIITIQISRSQLKSLENVVVLTASGLASVTITKRHAGGSNSRTVTEYHVTIGEQRFHVSESEYYAFKEGNSYTVYYMDNNGSLDIVSAIPGA